MTFAVAAMFVHALNNTDIQVSVLIVPKLAASIRNSVCVHLHAIPHLQNLPLAHMDYGSVNLLSGLLQLLQPVEPANFHVAIFHCTVTLWGKPRIPEFKIQ